MSNFIKKLKNTKEDDTPSYLKVGAYLIDNLILFTIRYLVFILCYLLWFGRSLYNFSTEISNKYSIGGILEHGATHKIINDFFNHIILWDSIFIVLVLIIIGAIYYSWSLSSTFHATFGMRLMKLEIVKKDEGVITLPRILVRYCLGLVPWTFYVIALISVALEQNKAAFMIIFLTYVWYKPHIIGRVKRSLHDMICKTNIQRRKRP